MPRQPNYYRILDVALAADQAEIKHAYRVLAKRYHPDRVPRERREWARTQMARINAAYEVLGDPARRAAYDRQQGYTAPHAAQAEETGPSSSPHTTKSARQRNRDTRLRPERWRRERLSRQRTVLWGSAVALGILLLGALYWWRALEPSMPQHRWTWAGLLMVGLVLVLLFLGRAVR